MGPVFDTPQWKLTQAEGPQKYGFVDNILHVQPARGRQMTKYINVPTEAFPVLETIFSGVELRRAREEGIGFFLDEMNGDWYLGIACHTSDIFRYLWRYTPAKLPGWMVAKAV